MGQNLRHRLAVGILAVFAFSFLFALAGQGTRAGADDGGRSPDHAGIQIIADHPVVALYEKIPQRYIDEEKKMFLSIPGNPTRRDTARVSSF